MTEKIQIAVLTDLHACADLKSSEYTSWVHAQPKPEESNPFSSLDELIIKEELKSDILLCCGDIADKADWGGQQYAWKKIKELGNQLSVKDVFATAGNHDLDSRQESLFDPKGNLQALQPLFPGGSPDKVNQYWAQNFCIYVDDTFVLLNINSCAFHGYRKQDSADEWKHGRISDRTISLIDKELGDIETQGKVKIVFFHHHPIDWEVESEDGYSKMKGGQGLLDLLSKFNGESWLVIHGHKHNPDILYSAGGSNSPTIFSAGSFSSKRLQSASEVKNQFYIVELEIDPIKKYCLPIAGKVFAWSWNYKTGWTRSSFLEGVPYCAGFGCRESSSILANQISELVNQSENYLNWSEIVNTNPKLDFILPTDLKKLKSSLEDVHNVNIHLSEQGQISLLSKGGA